MAKPKPVGHALSGKTSDRIRSGEIPKEATRKIDRTDPPPDPKSVRHGSGQGLGSGATRRRGGKEK